VWNFRPRNLNSKPFAEHLKSRPQTIFAVDIFKVSNRIFFWGGIFRGVYFSDFGIQLAGMKMNQKKEKRKSKLAIGSCCEKFWKAGGNMLISSRANPYFVLFLPIHNPFWLISLDKMVSQSFYPFSIWSAESPGCGFPQILDLHRWLGGLLIIYLYLGNGSEFQLLLRLCCLIASARLGFRLYLNLILFLFYFIWFLVIYFVLCVFWIPLHWEVMGGIAIAGCQDIAWMVIKMCGWNAQEKCPRTLIVKCYFRLKLCNPKSTLEIKIIFIMFR